jgi:hypothetical protein
VSGFRYQVAGIGLLTSGCGILSRKDNLVKRREGYAAGACGFVEEGRMREHIWLAGRYVDNVIMGIVREEWREGRTVG